MAMSRRHFQKIADAIAEAARTAESYRENGPEFQAYATARMDSVQHLMYALADVCASENPNFDRARFLAACQPKE
jgi:Flp pilus assembly protein TadG